MRSRRLSAVTGRAAYLCVRAASGSIDGGSPGAREAQARPSRALCPWFRENPEMPRVNSPCSLFRWVNTPGISVKVLYPARPIHVSSAEALPRHRDNSAVFRVATDLRSSAS
jgi:hypothetical protein